MAEAHEAIKSVQQRAMGAYRPAAICEDAALDDEVRQARGQECESGQGSVEQEQRKEFVVAKSDAIVDPWTCQSEEVSASIEVDEVRVDVQ